MRWRVPPVDRDVLGKQAASGAPSYEQLLVDVGPGNARERMRSVRRAVIRTLREEGDVATLVSASTTKVVYKGLLSSSELGAYFADLRDPLCSSRFAVFHQRFSTNTSPSWRLVQPFGTIAHNGEIDTITGNRAWMRARGVLSPRGASDSLEFDVALDAMVGAGYRVDEAVDLMLSPAIDDDDRLRAYYDAHIPTVEPWDGPAAIVFAEGDRVGAALDRSGFRPLRWCRTESGKVLAASEAGVVDFGGDAIVERGRLGPGERIVVRFATGELIRPDAFRALRRDNSDFRSTVASWRFEMPARTAAARGRRRRAAARSGAFRLHRGRAEAGRRVARRRRRADVVDGRRRGARVPRAPPAGHRVPAPALRAGDEPADRRAARRVRVRHARVRRQRRHERRRSRARQHRRGRHRAARRRGVRRARLRRAAGAAPHRARLRRHDACARASTRSATRPSTRCATARRISCSTTAARRCRFRRCSPPARCTSA